MDVENRNDLPNAEAELDPQTPLAPKSFTLRGGILGALLVYFISLTLIAAVFFPTVYRERLGWASLMTSASLQVAGIAMILSLITAIIGFFAGREGAKCKTVNKAFLQGAFLCGLATLICLPALYFTYFRLIRMYTSGFIILCFIFFAIITASGSLVSGLAAINVRDRRESGRTRLIPQFTLQEIFIVFTIVSVIISAMTSAAVLRM